MLKDKGFNLEEGSVYGFRSDVVGDVIAKVISVREKDILVQQPLQLAQLPDGKVGFVPAFPLANQSKPMVFPLSNLLYYEVNDEVKAGYGSSTSSLVVPKRQGIITN